MQWLSKLGTIAQSALGAVLIAENTATTESTGASKQQLAMDIVKNEAGLIDAVPAEQPVINSVLTAVINSTVAFMNLKGVFAHKKASAQTPAVTK
jgi:hypothetical protein